MAKRTYFNNETQKEIELDLTESEERFYLKAVRKFELNTEWLKFDEFAFGWQSPIYQNQKSHLDVLQQPLYLALKDMSMQLGVQQGLIKRPSSSHGRE